MKCRIPMKLSIFVVFLFVAQALDAQTVRVAKEPRPLYQRDLYLNELLQQALHAVDPKFNIEHIEVHPHQQRTLHMLDGKTLDIHSSMATDARASIAIAIRVPLFKGLIGQRVLVANEANAARLVNVTSLAELAQFEAVQGHDWPDTHILAANQLPVKPMSQYEAMFALTALGRVNYFPRSVIEVNDELSRYNNESVTLKVVDNLLLAYPAHYYFFVSNNKPELAKKLEQGLLKIKANGVFDSLFEQYFAADLATLKLEQRTALPLTNPYFSTVK